ncbi:MULTISPECIES: ATP-binding protein [unclassified Thalassospira]|uniref:ATP-binding protein n=1 Tax=unclassified Thalassospira TaxID=2648997 RepID=UPI0007A5E808|nr:MULTISPECIES: ATP-binding protein [unclassified Thalassospira]KZD01373.1 hypothetical protein AUQ41_19445 [Thalassospira sp. MCCC 1A02898]ONH88264.1 ATP-dependent OLD family endonuclease [Thalassospira sp. MCCC 1A02803]
MRLIGLTLENFRCYSEAINVKFDNLTALVGQNDVGKSSLLDALAIFFEEAQPDKDDASKNGDPKKMRIACEFDQLPDALVVDANHSTSLAAEHLVTANRTLVINKVYNGSIGSPKVSAIFAEAEHPTARGYDDLLKLKRAELVKRAEDLGVDLAGVDKRVNAELRAAIWGSCINLQKIPSSVPLEEEGGKQLWTALQAYLPAFALFKSDRASSDQDNEAQDPLNMAIREAIKEVEPRLLEIQEHVESEVKKIAAATVEKLKEMDPNIAETLDPIVTTKKWEKLFSTSITGDNGIPLNKRGSGVRRLVLLNFFRAKAEKGATDKSKGSIIYAIEEPETSQHPRNQRLLMSALSDLSSGDGRQVILTTHTPMLARLLPMDQIRYIKRLENNTRSIEHGTDELSGEIAKSLGVLPDHNVKIFVGVEGPNDILFMKGMARVLRNGGVDVPDLEKLELDGELIFFPFGGSNLAVWASRLRHLNRPEFHVCDRDNPLPHAPKYDAHVNEVNGRDNCKATSTRKREMENYLHPDAVVEAYQGNGMELDLPKVFEDFDDVPEIVAKAVHTQSSAIAWDALDQEKISEKIKRAKRQLNSVCVSKMNSVRLQQSDPDSEIHGWFTCISELMD